MTQILYLKPSTRRIKRRTTYIRSVQFNCMHTGFTGVCEAYLHQFCNVCSNMVVVVLMGVCGCGKTTVGEALAARLGWLFADADDFHSKENKEKMRSAIPLTDEDRLPWLQKIHKYITSDLLESSKEQNCVITCSALKRMYRNILRSGTPSISQKTAILVNPSTSNDHVLAGSPPKSPDILFVHLKGPRELLEKRMAGRKGHFMPSDLLASQLATLEEPEADENCMTVDIADSVPDIVNHIAKGLEDKQ